MHVAVVGAGAWGLPAAAELARRGHRVTVVDRYGPGNPLSSSAGPTRLWRLADPDRRYVRLARRGAAAMDRLERRADVRVRVRLGLLWRATSLDRLLDTLREEGVPHVPVAAGSVGRHLPGLRTDGRDAVWIPDAGIVLVTAALAAYQRLLAQDGGTLVLGRAVEDVVERAGRVALVLDDGTGIDADVAVLAPGPGAVQLLPRLGVPLPLRPYAEQVVHLGELSRPGAFDDVPCLVDGPTGEAAGIYAMPTPGVGYKVGLDVPLRALEDGDVDRTPDPDRTAAIEGRARRDLAFLPPRALDAQVCTWTDSPDGRFVVDRLGPVVLAVGDCGEGFKYSALMGEVLADLAEGRDVDDDVAALSLARLAGTRVALDRPPTSLGSH